MFPLLSWLALTESFSLGVSFSLSSSEHNVASGCFNSEERELFSGLSLNLNSDIFTYHLIIPGYSK